MDTSFGTTHWVRLTYPCSKCGAQPGQKCVGGGVDWDEAVHNARRFLYELPKETSAPKETNA